MKRDFLYYLCLAQIASDQAKENYCFQVVNHLYFLKEKNIIKALKVLKGNAFYSKFDNVIYFETPIGQISFHCWNDEIINHEKVIQDNYYKWTGYKGYCTKIVWDYVGDYYVKTANRYQKEAEIFAPYDHKFDDYF